MRNKIRFELRNKSGVLQCDPNILKIVREKFSIPNPSYTGRKFSPRKYVITPTGAFEIGLLGDIRNYIESLDIDSEITVSDELFRAFSPKFKEYEIENIDGFTYYDHQYNTIVEFLKNGRGLGLLATSAGKSLIIGGLVKTLLKYNPNFKILIVVPNTTLLHQIYHSFIDEYDIPSISRWGDDLTPDWSKNIVVSNSQILTSNITQSIELLRDFNCVIVDEVHRLGDKTNQINKVIHNIPTVHKFGLTGTLPDNYLAIWNVVGKIGPILYEESSYSLRAKGAASQVRIQIIVCQHKDSPPIPKKIGNIPLPPTARYDAESEFVYESDNRNKVIVKIGEKIKGNTLVLVDSIKHGEELYRLFVATGRETYFVRGSMSTSERREIFKRMEENDSIICVAMSQIFSTGISVNNLPNIIFTAIGKSNVKISQSIGRSMRLHKNKDEAVIYDIADNTYYSLSHLKLRMALYNDSKIKFNVKKIRI